MAIFRATIVWLLAERPAERFFLDCQKIKAEQKRDYNENISADVAFLRHKNSRRKLARNYILI